MSFILVRYRDEIVDDSARACPPQLLFARAGVVAADCPSRPAESGPQQSHPDGTFEPPAAMADQSAPEPAPAPSHEGTSKDYAPPGNSA